MHFLKSEASAFSENPSFSIRIMMQNFDRITMKITAALLLIPRTYFFEDYRTETGNLLLGLKPLS